MVMAARKEDEIMAEYLLKGGKMLEKSCRKCGCPMFEVKGKTFCVVCAENERAAQPAKKPADAPVQVHVQDTSCACGQDHGEDSCEGGMLADELAMTILALCERIHNEKDPNHILTLMNSVKVGTEALQILCQL
jgi:UPF0148 protein